MLNRRLLRLAAPMALGALALTACGGGSDNAGSGGGGKPTYKIAFQGPISGDNAAIGENEGNGVQLAIELANQKGDLPFTLAYAGQDDVGTPEGGPPAARKSIDDKQVMAVVGPAFSGATKSSGKLFAAAKLAAISPSATNPTLTSKENGFSSFFRVVPPDDAQGKEAADYIAKVIKAKTVYSVDDKSEYGVGLADVFNKTLEAQGVTVLKESVPKTKDYSTVAQKINNKKPDAVWYSGYYPELALLAKSLKSVGYAKPLLSGDGSNDDAYITSATADVAEGTYLFCPCGDANVDPKAKTFADAFKAKFSKPAGTYSPESFDATNAVIEAMKSVGGADLTREKVLDAIRKVDYAGITKQVKFTENGEVEGTTIFVFQVKGGKRAVLGTTLELVK